MVNLLQSLRDWRLVGWTYLEEQKQETVCLYRDMWHDLYQLDQTQLVAISADICRGLTGLDSLPRPKALPGAQLLMQRLYST